MTTKHASISLLAAAAAIMIGASPLLAQKSTARHEARPQHETQDQLQAEAKIPMDSARTTALARVKDGTVKSQELEREHGRLVYSFDIATPKRSGVDEVNVDAKTGKVVGRVIHESAAKERAEAKAEAKSDMKTDAKRKP